MVESNLRLVVKLAGKYRGLGLPMSDLVQEGTIGLMRAAEKFDHRRGFKFSTYASYWIRQSIQRALQNHGRAIRLPVHQLERLRKVARMQRELTVELGREPTLEEISAATGMELRHVIRVTELPGVTVSLDTPVSEESDLTLGDVHEDDAAPSPFELAVATELRGAVAELPEDERRVIELRFSGVQTQREVAGGLGTDVKGVRRLERLGLERLRERLSGAPA